MKVFQYLVLETYISESSSFLEEMLNSKGQEGWELCYYGHYEHGINRVIFKKEILLEVPILNIQTQS
jgi:hypothetical protein